MFNIIGTVLMVQLCKLLRSMGPSGLLSLYFKVCYENDYKK